jgi:hypothetical protein
MRDYAVLNVYERLQMVNMMLLPATYETRMSYLVVNLNGGAVKQFVKTLILRPLLKLLYWLNPKRPCDRRRMPFKSYQIFPTYGPMVLPKNLKIISFYTMVNDNLAKPFMSFAEFIGNW